MTPPTIPEIVRVRLACGTTYERGQVIHPACGFVPPDFVITGFAFTGSRRTHLCMVGYHTAAKSRRLITRGCWETEGVAINPGVSRHLDALIAEMSE